MKKISIIVPVFNEENLIKPFFVAISEVMQKTSYSYELIFINDGSLDDTQVSIDDLGLQLNNIKFIKFSRNFGKEPALAAGIDAASGDAAIIMDVDMQDPPEVIHQLIEAWEAGADTAVAVRTSRKSDSFLKRLSAQMYYRIFNSLTDEVKIPFNAGDFRLVDRRVIDSLRTLRESSRFTKGLFSWVGFKTQYVFFERAERSSGKTNFNFSKLFLLGLNGILGFSTKPLRIWTFIGSISILIATVVGLRILYLNIFFGRDAPGLVTILFIVAMFSGVQLLGIGLLGEYIGRIFIETKARPLYIIDDTNTDLRVGPRL